MLNIKEKVVVEGERSCEYARQGSAVIETREEDTAS